MSTGERIFVIIAVLATIVWVAVVWFALTTPPIRVLTVSTTFHLKRTRLPGNPADDYEEFDSNRRFVGRIMLHPQAPKDQPWFWTITAREIPPLVHNHGYSATREQAMTDFKARYMGATRGSR